MVDGLGHANFSNAAVAEELDCVDNALATSALGAVLDAFTGFFCGCREQGGFLNIVRARFFNVDMCACLECRKCAGGVPVIGRRDADAVDVWIFQEFSEVGVTFYSLALGRGVDGSIEVRGIDIGDSDDFAVGGREESFVVMLALAADTDHSVTHGFAGGRGCFLRC